MADLPITSDAGATPIVVNDPTTTANVANVKAASTASVAADNSLVVALSPNSPVPTGTNNIGVTGVAQGSTTSGEHGDLVQGAVTTAAPSYVTAQTNPLSLTTAGDLRVVSKTEDGSGTAITSTALDAKQGLDVNLIASPSQSAASSGQVYTTVFEFNLPTNGTESPAVFIKNPSGSGKTLVLKLVSASCEDATNGAAVIRIYGDPTTSANGTSQTISSTSIGGGAGASAMTAFSGPTASANGAIVFAINTGSGNVSTPADMPINFDGLIRVSANHTLLVTGEPTTNNMNYSFTVIWQEV
jgi:hypothetical protein